MTKHHWKESIKSFRRHIDPEMEEQLRWIKIETENKLKRSLKLVKSINQNREGNLKKKTELTNLIEDINKEYQSIYGLYDNLRGDVRRLVSGDEAGSYSSTNSNSDSEYYTPEESKDRISVPNGEQQNGRENDSQKSETSDSEDGILKDKLTSTSEIKRAPDEEALLSPNEVPESGLIIKDVEIQEEQSEGMMHKLLDECSELKKRLNEREEKILSITKKHNASEDKKLADIKVLEAKVTSLKLELKTMSTIREAFEEQVECKSEEANQVMEENSGLQVQVVELENRFKVKENQIGSLHDQFEEDKKEFQEQMINLQKELEFISHQKSESESQLKKKSQEVSECLLEIENLREKLANRNLNEEEIAEEKVCDKMNVEDLELEISSLSSQKCELENQIISTKSEAYHLRVENEKLYGQIFVLETTMKEGKDELSALQEKLEVRENEMSTQVRSLTAELQNFQEELETLRDENSGLQVKLKLEKQDCSQNLTHTERTNMELTNKIADQQKSLTSLQQVINKLNEEYKQVQNKLGDAKSNYQIAEKKVEEMAEEFFKKCEDKVRILSRRIRVAEQLHVENKEWYHKTKDKYEQHNKELKESLQKSEVWLSNMKEMSLTADNTLSALDGVALKFEGCTANFLNRISKVSCELKFAKDWIRRKNKAMVHVKDDLHCLLAQLDEKEAEILLYREKVWKSENKVRELEKLMDEKEEGMLALKEEKREAIRQLCVWIDYHRSHSDHYKKILSDINVASKKAR